MIKYMGVKFVEAESMDSVTAHKKGYRVHGDAQTEAIDGMEITYKDGYKSWTPMRPFVEGYYPIGEMPFGHAIEAAKKGIAIARKGWNGKKMFVVMMPPLSLPPFNTQDTSRKVNDRTAKYIGEDRPLNCVPYFAMYAANGDWVPGWLASQTDMLADDWTIIEDTVAYINS